jgi:hypothetical protein
VNRRSQVVEEHGSYYCEAHSQSFPECKHRYVASVHVTDFSGGAWVSMFNDQAEALIGQSADSLAELKGADEDAFKRVLKVPNTQFRSRPCLLCMGGAVTLHHTHRAVTALPPRGHWCIVDILFLLSVYAWGLQAALFKRMALRVKSKTDEYQGVQKRKIMVHSLQPMDYAAESNRLLSLIAAM